MRQASFDLCDAYEAGRLKGHADLWAKLDDECRDRVKLVRFALEANGEE